MSLRERFINENPDSSRLQATDARSTLASRRSYQELKQRFHQTLLDRVDLARLQKLDPAQLSDEIRVLVEHLLEEEGVALTEADRRTLVRDIRYEMLGLGPLEPLLADPTVSDILVNTYK